MFLGVTCNHSARAQQLPSILLNPKVVMSLSDAQHLEDPTPRIAFCKGMSYGSSVQCVAKFLEASDQFTQCWAPTKKGKNATSSESVPKQIPTGRDHTGIEYNRILYIHTQTVHQYTHMMFTKLQRWSLSFPTLATLYASNHWVVQTKLGSSLRLSRCLFRSVALVVTRSEKAMGDTVGLSLAVDLSAMATAQVQGMWRWVKNPRCQEHLR